MSRIAIDGSDYAGRTSGLPWRLPHDRLDCRRCGSSLHGRRQRVRWATVGKATFQVEVFRCRCGAGRNIRREVAAG
jgi:hypothetical protein